MSTEGIELIILFKFVLFLLSITISALFIVSLLFLITLVRALILRDPSEELLKMTQR